TYAALNVIQELAEDIRAYMHPINFFDGSFGVILIVPDSHTADEQMHRMKLLCDQIIRALRDTLRMSATIVLGGPSSTWTDVPHILEQAKRALHYRSFDAGSQLLEADTVLSQKNDWIDYPLELEQDFIHALNLGLQRDALRSLSRFVTSLQAGGGSEWHVHHGLMRLITSVHRSM
ncbi:AraC family transcriptional regulator, partial [Rhodospirillum rubrum]|nr:AraC family transcriptional regulator [Rhodospirillum rubrum]